MSKLIPAIVLCLISAVSWGGREAAPWVGESLSGSTCTGPRAGNFGPFDYRVDKDKLPVVENRHFTARVEQLRRGETTGNAMGDVNYTLSKFPNHHRALYSAVKFSLGQAGEGSRRRYPAECYLQRAIHFRPDDSVPHMLYGLYLHQSGHLDMALEKYRAAEDLAPRDANLLYNIGLVLFDRGDHAESLKYAKQAYRLGMPLPGLRRKLQDAGYWN